MFIVLHTCIRNDADSGKKINHINMFSNESDALKFVMDETKNEEFNDEEKEKIEINIEDGIWIWEWKRRGNGDYYKIFKVNNKKAFSFEVDIEDSYTVRE